MNQNKKIFFFSLIFSLLLLFLTGLFLWHKSFWFANFSVRTIRPKPAAKINGELIWQYEVEERLADLKEFMESQYGEGVFKGEKGQLLLTNLEQKILAEILEEKLIAQEAKKLGIQISEEHVQRELEGITRKISGNLAKLDAELEWDKKFKKSLQNYVRNLLILNALSSAKTDPHDPSPDNFLSWLVEAKRKARVEIYGGKDLASSLFSRGCCASGGCIFPRSEENKIDAHLEEKARTAALQAYKKNNPGAQNLIAKVKDYGCHIQVDIEREGKVVKSYVYQRGEVEE